MVVVVAYSPSPLDTNWVFEVIGTWFGGFRTRGLGSLGLGVGDRAGQYMIFSSRWMEAREALQI